MPVTLSFHGGVDTVTGSCHLLCAGGLRILVDCGLFQGGPELEEKNYDGFGFDPASIDYLLLTHGHLDHCGRIPVLVKNGFRGKILTTSATYEIAKIIFLDTARIQEEDYEHWSRISRRKGQRPREPLYTTLDAVDALRFFDPLVQYGQDVLLNDRVAVTFRDAGHIFGAAFVEVRIRGYDTVLFSGDIGNRNKPIIRDPSFADRADVVVIEGTYADRVHKGIRESVEELRQAIVDTCSRGGNILIPSFAVERAQDILYYLRKFREKGDAPACSVYLDSPMAINIADIMRKYPEYYDRQTAALFQEGKSPFSFDGLKFIRTSEESRQINFIRSHAIIIAGSGMCTGGRIKHHLKHNIWRKESSIVFVGYQAEGTLGREIVDGARTARIFGEPYRVHAKVYTIGGFSAHADREILLDWLQHIGSIKKVFLVHGENESLRSFQREIRRSKIAPSVLIPRLHQSFQLKH